jgi:hypothetical protein
MAKSDKPNILIIWGDDIGYWNISHYSMGMMGYPTPTIAGSTNSSAILYHLNAGEEPELPDPPTTPHGWKGSGLRPRCSACASASQ